MRKIQREPIFLSPIFKHRVWGGNRLSKIFRYNLDCEHIGEAWGIASHSNGNSLVQDGKWQGLTLEHLWLTQKELFGSDPSIDADHFPYLIKLLDAKQDLSLQVHPNDKQAQALEGYPLGKNECWYVIDCEPNAEIILGHNAKSADQLSAMIQDKDWDGLLKRVKVKSGDFYYVPSGTLHAIGKGVQIFEIQQNSDITYRVYDYDRKTIDGELRELHTQKAIKVIGITNETNKITKTEYKHSTGASIIEWQTGFELVLKKLHLPPETKIPIQTDSFIMGFLLDAAQTASIITKHKAYSCSKGEFFILPASTEPYILSEESTWLLASTQFSNL